MNSPNDKICSRIIYEKKLLHFDFASSDGEKLEHLNETQIIGVHILLNLGGCPSHLLERVSTSLDFGSQAISNAGLMEVGIQSHQFQPYGATVLFLLSESHLSIHTWPERGVVACDIFCCTDKQSLDMATVKAKKASEVLARLFEAKVVREQIAYR
jgi:S-adenosylmethionine decarboxylase